MLPLQDVPLRSRGCSGAHGNVAYTAEDSNLTVHVLKLQLLFMFQLNILTICAVRTLHTLCHCKPN